MRDLVYLVLPWRRKHLPNHELMAWAEDLAEICIVINNEKGG